MSSAFYNLCFAGDIKGVKELIEKNNDQDIDKKTWDDGLHYASRNGHLKILKFLISKAKEIGKKIDWDDCILGGCYGKRSKVVKFAVSKAEEELEEGKRISWYDWLIDVYRSRSLKIVKFMTTKASEQETFEQDDWNQFLQYACQVGHLKTIQFLMTKGANDWHSGFEDACRFGAVNSEYRLKCLKIIPFLFSKIEETGGDVNCCLATACYNKCLEIIPFLISKIDETSSKNILRTYYQWPVHKDQITKLLYIKTPLSAFQNINGFQELNNTVVTTKHAIKTTSVLIPDLLNIVAQCIIV